MKNKILPYFIIALTASVFCETYYAQVFGPNSPSTENSFGTGNNWVSSSILASDNTYTQSLGMGSTRFLRGRNFGFGLLNTDVVQGIRVEVEKKVNALSNVALMNTWRHGELSTITNVPLSAGNNRFMIAYIAIENGNAPIVSSMTYGGVNMTRLISIYNSTSFDAQMEVWYLTEAQLATLAVGNYNVVANLGAFVQNQYFDILSTAIYQNVDPINPFLDVQTGSTALGVPNPWQLPNPLNVEIGGMAVNGVFCGNNTSPAVTNGGTNCWTINSGFIEVVDVYRSNAGASTSGGCFQAAQLASAATGTEQPSTTFNGTSNRRIVIALSLRRASVLDEIVQLQKNAVTVGNNYGQTSVYWPIVDTYVSYGGPTDLWGTSWIWSDINNANFAAILTAVLYNGTAQVDHMRVTVYTSSILPVQLIDFFAHQTEDNKVQCSWLTASEINSDYFYVERSQNGFEFEALSRIDAAGNSTSLLNYDFIDENPLDGISYYRLKMVDKDGTTKYSDIKSVERKDNIQFVIYPNPMENWATVKANQDNYKLMIITSDGRVIDSSKSHAFGKSYRFNIADEPDGTYYLILENEDGRKIQTFQKRTKSN